MALQGPETHQKGDVAFSELKEAMVPRVAVVGGGVFGLMCAIRLAEDGLAVHLFERHRELMQGASAWSNRLHMGYHYPRDQRTVTQCLRGHDRFKKEFAPAMLQDVRNAYFISRDGSLTCPDAYLEFCRRNNLPFEVINKDGFNPIVQNVALGIQTDETIYSPDILRRLLLKRLEKNNIRVSTETRIAEIKRANGPYYTISSADGYAGTFDYVVNSTYTKSSELDSAFCLSRSDKQFELVRVAVIELDWPKPKSITVMDGPFFSLLPLDTGGRYLLIHVDKSVIRESIGVSTPSEWAAHHYDVSSSEDIQSWFADLLRSYAEFIPSLQSARLIRVFEQPRMVLANKEATDERPSVVDAENGYFSVFSGKSDHSVWVADQVRDLIRSQRA